MIGYCDAIRAGFGSDEGGKSCTWLREGVSIRNLTMPN